MNIITIVKGGKGRWKNQIKNMKFIYKQLKQQCLVYFQKIREETKLVLEFLSEHKNDINSIAERFI